MVIGRQPFCCFALQGWCEDGDEREKDRKRQLVVAHVFLSHVSPSTHFKPPRSVMLRSLFFPLALATLSVRLILAAPMPQAASTLLPGQNAPPRERTACGANTGYIWTCNKWDSTETSCVSDGWQTTPCPQGTLCLNVVSGYAIVLKHCSG